ncbi:hypothetical protein H6F75_12615 [Nodosilinea sp. FACHB-131]|uniref:glycosyltransferase family 9 protein n=1 Tax=Cyanophyceae TaxID=3028117 RepID=UPI0016870075|nr:hypothetical protein [Nodosilinea sp. FACHB-131]MBD1874329.1 hypothetical protein [Nodosilinea sp. FACHB-131]
MPAKTTAKQSKVLIFNLRGGSPPPELKLAFPEAKLTVVDSGQIVSWLSADEATLVDWQQAIGWLRQGGFDAAVILTAPGKSPYTLGYLCYLAGIPIRIGQSSEFGGQVLSLCAPPDQDGDALAALLRGSGRSLASAPR